MDRIAAVRGYPKYLRFDHGHEFIAYAVADWWRFNGAETVFIDPGSPWQNAWIETFNGRTRDDLLNGERFEIVISDGTESSPSAIITSPPSSSIRKTTASDCLKNTASIGYTDPTSATSR